jgi:hypothetical protein
VLQFCHKSAGYIIHPNRPHLGVTIGWFFWGSHRHLDMSWPFPRFELKTGRPTCNGGKGQCSML